MQMWAHLRRLHVTARVQCVRTLRPDRGLMFGRDVAACAPCICIAVDFEVCLECASLSSFGFGGMLCWAWRLAGISCKKASLCAG